MQIDMASSEALNMIDRDYVGSSKPLSVNHRPAEAQSIEWWASRGQTESITQERKRSALRLYLHIASQATNELPFYTFPAAFSFSDQVHYRPDKGLVKALLRAHVLEACRCEGELCFRLNDRGTCLLEEQ